LQKLDAGEISARWFKDCRTAVEGFARFVGANRAVSDLSPEDFLRFRQKLIRTGLSSNGKSQGVCALTRTITIIKMIFNYAYEVDLIDKPLKYGKAFEKPSAGLKRKSRQAIELENGKRLFEPAEIRGLLGVAAMPLRAMILLGINAGFGNTDCARLPVKAVDFDSAVIEFDRPKTGIERTAPLWSETVEALRQALAERPKPVDVGADKLVFLTVFGRSWVREHVHRGPDGTVERVALTDAIGEEFGKILRKLGMKRKGIGFYTLRHTFRTWADEVRDQHAIHRIMGHVIPGMSGVYVEKIELNRLRAVVGHVRARLFSEQAGTSDSAQPPPPSAATAT
jgi:integrase